MVICIEGCIGVGKTTLAQKLSRLLDCQLVLENYQSNPFLKDYLITPQHYFFHVQSTFMCLQEREISKALSQAIPNSLFLADFHFLKSHVFNQLTISNSKGKSLCTKIHSYLFSKYKLPDLLIYLYSDEKTIMKRIIKRNEENSINIPLKFIRSLLKEYERYITTEYKGLVLTIDNTTIDYSCSESALKLVADLIRQKIEIN